MLTPQGAEFFIAVFPAAQGSRRSRERVVLRLLMSSGGYFARALKRAGWSSLEGRRSSRLVAQRGDRRAPHDGSSHDEFVETSAVGPAHE